MPVSQKTMVEKKLRNSIKIYRMMTWMTAGEDRPTLRPRRPRRDLGPRDRPRRDLGPRNRPRRDLGPRDKPHHDLEPRDKTRHSLVHRHGRPGGLQHRPRPSRPGRNLNLSIGMNLKKPMISSTWQTS